jgi:hypothetical protein
MLLKMNFLKANDPNDYKQANKVCECFNIRLRLKNRRQY